MKIGIFSAKCSLGEKLASRPVSRVLSRRAPQGHASATAIHLGCPLPDTSSNQPGRLAWKPASGQVAPPAVAPIWFCSRWGLPCRRRCRSARCALTAPFHPCCRAALRCASAVCFLWHFPWGRPRRPLAATVSPWSPDFPPPAGDGQAGAGAAAVRPTGPGDIAEPALKVKENCLTGNYFAGLFPTEQLG